MKVVLCLHPSQPVFVSSRNALAQVQPDSSTGSQQRRHKTISCVIVEAVTGQTKPMPMPLS